jgi:hypothetical protein
MDRSVGQDRDRAFSLRPNNRLAGGLQTGQSFVRARHRSKHNSFQRSSLSQLRIAWKASTSAPTLHFGSYLSIRRSPGSDEVDFA